MSRALITESNLTAIANAIRTKLGVQDMYTPPQMAAAVESIPTGGITPTGTKNITQNGTHDVTQYASANVNVQPNLQSKTVTENGTVTPDQGYDGLSSVVVNVSGGGEIIIDNIIPRMTSNTTPSGVASASSILSSAFDAYRAFDNTPALQTMQGGWLASSQDYTPWIQYEFESAAPLYRIKIYTANNGASATRVVTIEGRKNGVWENALKSGSNVTLTFTQNTYGDTCVLHNIQLNRETYDAIRITGNDRFYLGANQTACTFSEIQVYGIEAT